MPVSQWIPKQFSLEHIVVAADLMKYPRALLYTMGTTLLSAILQTLNAAFAGYAFARMKFRGSGLLFALVILTIVVPAPAIFLPQYMFFRNFDVFGIIRAITGSGVSLVGSPVSLYILSALGMGLRSGLYIYIFRQFFRGRPGELEEAAFVDGSGYIRTFFKVVLPNATSAVLTVAILSFVWNWNDTNFVSMFASNKLNLTVGLTSVFQEVDPIGWTSQALKDTGKYLLPSKNALYEQAVYQTGILLIIVPMVVVYLFVQRKFVESVGRSGIVG